MSYFDFDLNGIYRIEKESLPSMEDQYSRMYEFAKFLSSLGLPLTEWHPPSDSPANSLLNRAFDADGVTSAALAIARAEVQKPTRRTVRVWNGVEDGDGGMVIIDMVSSGPGLCNLSFSSTGIKPLADSKNAIAAVQKVIDIWKPICVQAGPYKYKSKRVFADRPAVGWLVYLPNIISIKNVPNAADLIPVMSKREQVGTIVLSVNDTFDAENIEHVKIANSIEIQLADQDLLPLTRDLARKRG
jgi:hypothetical protein